MWAHEYVAEATQLISDPVKAGEVSRELLAHLEEIKAEAVAAGVDTEMAEAMALTRMGPATKLARSLAQPHHAHLPWRHYLAIVPVLGLLIVQLFAPGRSGDVTVWLILLLIATLFPGLSFWRRLWHRVRLDAELKWVWVTEQPLRTAAGVAAVGAAGIGLIWLTLLVGWSTWMPTPLYAGAVLSLLPILLCVSWGRARYGLSPYLVATLISLILPLYFLPLIFISEWVAWWGISGILVAFYTTAGAVVVWAMEWWRRRIGSIKVVVEGGEHHAN